MSNELDSKLKIQVWAVAVTTAGTACDTAVTHHFDTLGFDKAKIHIYGITTTANTYNTLTVRHSDNTDGTVVTSYSDVSGLVGGTDSAGGFTINACTAGALVTLDTIDVDLRGKKRHLKVVAIPSVAMTAHIWADLFVGDESPNTPAEGGVTNYVRG